MSAYDPKRTSRRPPRRTAQFFDPKCDIVSTPDVVLGASDVMRRREFIALFCSAAGGGSRCQWPSEENQQATNLRGDNHDTRTLDNAQGLLAAPAADDFGLFPLLS